VTEPTDDEPADTPAFDEAAFRAHINREFEERFIKPAQRVVAERDDEIRRLRKEAADREEDTESD
jgi:hypothetical protein